MFGEGDDEQTCLLGEDWELWFQPQFHERTTLFVFTSGILSIMNVNGAISSSRILSQLQNAQTLVLIEIYVNIEAPHFSITLIRISRVSTENNLQSNTRTIIVSLVSKI